jgi:tRNA(Ile)-lysidine synthase
MTMPAEQIELNLPPGDAWAVGVSGGADSVALLFLLHGLPGLRLHVVHLNHELRGPAAEADAEFVRGLSASLGLPCHLARRSEIEAGELALPTNPSARYRSLRLSLFRRVVAQEKLNGVMLAHHRDDVAETVLHRLLRGSGYSGLTGMSAVSVIDGLTIARPLLNVGREALRAMLKARNQTWREDASNDSDDYLRNRLRRILGGKPNLTESLIDLANKSRRLSDWVAGAAPRLEASFPTLKLAALPQILARQSARQWLIAAGSPARELSPAVLDRLIELAADAATPHAQQFPGGLTIRRRAGYIHSR